jgi:hypothetical protein
MMTDKMADQEGVELLFASLGSATDLALLGGAPAALGGSPNVVLPGLVAAQQPES